MDLLWLMFLLVLYMPVGMHGSGIDPVQCNPGDNYCTVTNFLHLWNDREPCKVAKVAYPTTEEELIHVVADAVRQKQSIKVVSTLAHSFPKLVCPRGTSGLLISTSKYKSRIDIDKNAMTVTADAGVELGELFTKLAENDLAFPVSPSFNGISVAGVISTGAHGSSLYGRGGSLHQHVVGISIVVPAKISQGYAKLVKLTSADKDLNAAKLSLGVLGAISQVTFAVQPMFKRSVIKESRNDSNLEDLIVEIARDYEFGEINWHINQKKLLLTLSKRVPVNTPGNGKNINYTPRSGASVKYWRGVGEQLIASGNETAICEISLTNIDSRVKGGDGLVNNGTFTGYPVVGFNNLMQIGGGCQNSSFTSTGDKLTCPWDPDLPGQVYFEAGIYIPISKLKEVITDIKKLRDINPDKLCGLNLYGGTIIRFVRGSSAYLGNPHDSVVIDILAFRYRQAGIPIVDEDALEELEQLLLFKHKGIPHWGKNRDFAFEDVGSKVKDLGKFLKIRKKMDPEGLFSSEWSDAILGIRKKGGRKVSIVKDHCALEGVCLCSKDSHCAPQEAFFCKRGVLYKDARVCRKTSV